MKLDLTKAPVQSPTGWKISAGGQLCVQARTQPVAHVPAPCLSWDPACPPCPQTQASWGWVVRTAKCCWELIRWWQLLGSLTAGATRGIRWVIAWEGQQTANWGRKDEVHGSVGFSGLNVHPATDCRDGNLWPPPVSCHPALPRSPLLCSSGLRFAIPPFSQLYCCPKKDLSYRMAEAIGAGL